MIVSANKFFLSLSVVFLFASCRKGKEDPFFSFHSRKARVAGNWRISNYDANTTTTYNYKNGSTQTESFNRTFGVVNYHEITSGSNIPTFTLDGKISVSSYHFDKTGNWNSVLEYYLYAPQAVGGFYTSKTRIEEEGKWDFLGSGQGLKKNESMSLQTTQSKHYFFTYSTYLGTVVDSTADSAVYTYASQEKVATWKLIALWNSRMKAEITSSSSFVSNNSGNAGTNIAETSTTAIEMNQ